MFFLYISILWGNFQDFSSNSLQIKIFMVECICQTNLICNLWVIFHGITIPFFVYAIIRPFTFGKNVVPCLIIVCDPYCSEFVWRQLGFCVFRCAGFGWRTFYFHRKIFSNLRRNRKNS